MATAGPTESLRGGRVPTDLSLPAWDDSVLCRVATPPLVRRAPLPVLIARGTTGAAPDDAGDGRHPGNGAVDHAS
ncbi:MAG: hypothetical protein KJO75_10085 [Dactylosporangium sp.]|nr:hypothetical protein [Dactylosporangium sp.]